MAAEPNVAAPAESPAAPATTEPPAAVAATPDASPPPAPPAPAAPIAAAAPDGALAAPATVAAATPCPAVPECECARPKAPTHWGMTIDAGFPDMAGIGILYRPWYWLRLEAAGTTTVYASNGYRVGLSLVPFDFPLTPSLTVNYGRALEADWNKALAKFGQPNADLEPVLRKFGYQYVDAHVGLELGAPRRFIFFVRAGLTQIWTQLHGLTDAAAAQLTKGSATISDTSVTARVPSVKLGFLIYFF